MADPIKNVTLGGLTYNANDAKTAKENGDGTYTIFFKTGETLTYPKQSGLRMKPEDEQWNGEMLQSPDDPDAKYNSGVFDAVHPRVSQRVDGGLITDDVYFDISEVMGAKFTSHKDNVSKVTLQDCVDTMVNLAANNSRVWGDTVKIKGGSGNEVVLDKKDSATIVQPKRNINIEGKGIAAQNAYDVE